jgi:pilin isopeptide linkage protein
MGKFKKFLSAILVMAMVFTLNAFTVLADESAQTTGDSLDRLKFSKTFKTENGGDILPTEEFEFKMEPVTVTNEGEVDSIYNIPKYSGIDTLTSTIKFEASTGMTSVTNDGEFDLSGLKAKFKEKLKDMYYPYAAFSYKISEVTPDADNIDNDIIYSSDSYYVDVWVDKTGEICAYVNVSNSSDAKKIEKTPITFTNTYKADATTSELLVKKTVAGSMGDKNKDFQFLLSVYSSSEKAQTFKGTIYRKDDDKGEQVDINNNQLFAFNLKDGEYLSIKGIPEGSHYAIKELEEAGYTVAVECTREVSETERTTNEKSSNNVYDSKKRETPIVNGLNIIEYTNTANYAAPEKSINELEFTKIFENTGGNVLPDETFEFSMTPATGITDDKDKTSDGISIRKGIALVNDKVSISFKALTDNEQKGKFSLVTKEALTGPAVYRYTVQEVSTSKGENDPITYDDSVYTVDLTVDNAGNIVEVTSLKVGDNTDSNDMGITFRNTCKFDDLAIVKKVTGENGEKDREFHFTLDIPAAGDNINLTEGKTLSGVIEKKDADSKAVTITVGTPFGFDLKDGEALVIKNVPEGMIYTVTEDEYDGYKTTIAYTSDIKDNAGDVENENTKTVRGNVYNATKKGQNTPIVEGGNTVVFTNNKEAFIDSGINLDVIPYVVVFVIAAVGVALFATRKKRVNRF